ncbi:hypothetical protein GCM10029978_014670 [Actinoallomurus acanthiterrae]
MIRATFVGVGGLTLAALLPAPALAATSPPPAGKTTWSYPYAKSHCFDSKPLKKAVVAKITGHIRYWRNVTPKYRFVSFHDPTLINPKVDIQVFTSCKKGHKTTKLSKVSVSQIWYDWSCKSSTGISKTLNNWAIGFGASQSCGWTRTARRSTGYGKGSHFVQNNTGAPVKWNWGDGKTIHRGGKICLHADLSVTPYVGTTSDADIKPISVCVTASYAAKP